MKINMGNMAKKFKNKYRIGSARKPNWDYRTNGMYYVTICTGNRALHFGDVCDEEMIFTDIGRIANTCWLEIPEHFEFVQLDEFQIMPNHMHGLLKIQHDQNNAEPLHVEPVHATVLRNGDQNKNEKMAGISPKKGSLSTIIRSYKSAVTKDARIIDPGFTWQAKFHDSIVRDFQSLINIRNYIKNNPKNWRKDKLNPL